MSIVTTLPNKTILVVDDEKNIRFAVVHALKGGRFEVDSASSGAEALAKCRAKHYDLLLVDLRMPGMTGLQMLNEVHREGPTEAPPAVIITAHALASELFEAATLGAIDFVRKPFSIQAIRAMVSEIFERLEHEEAVARTPSEAEDMLRRAKIHLMRGRCPEAEPLLKASAALDAASVETFWLLGLCALLQKRADEAITNFRYVLHIDPLNTMAAEYLSWLVGRTEE
jgi:DNA-binding NtrC family response regulator